MTQPIPPQNHGYPYGPPYGSGPGGWYDPQAKSKLAAGLLAIFLGGLGIHRFYLGDTNRGVLMLLLSVLSCFILYPIIHIWGLVEGVLYLSGSSGYTTDATGRPLRD